MLIAQWEALLSLYLEDNQMSLQFWACDYEIVVRDYQSYINILSELCWLI